MTTAAAEPVPATRVRAAIRADALALGLVGALGLVLAVVTWGTWGDLDSDTGYDLVAGARVADGAVPYRDFVYYYGPLAPALTALASLLGGAGFGPGIALGFGIAAAIVAGTYALARTQVGPLGSALAAVLVSAIALVPDNYSYVLPHTYAATTGTLLLVGLLLALHRFAATGRSAFLATAGAAAGLLTLTKPEPAAAGFAALAAWFLLCGRKEPGRLRNGALIIVPALTIPAVVYGAFALTLSPARLLTENLYPVDTLRAGGDTLVNARMPLDLESIIDLTARGALYAVGVALLLGLGWALRRAPRPTVVGLALCAIVATVASFANPEALREGLKYAYGWVPLGAALAAAALVLAARRTLPSADAQVRLAGAIALAVVAFTAYAGFFFQTTRPQMAVYYAPLAAVFLARLHLVELARGRAAALLGAGWLAFLAAASVGLTINDAHAESATVRGPGGALAETPAEAELYRGALAWIRRDQTGPVFVAPLMTGLYVLSGRASPLPELSLLPSALPDADDEDAAIRRLEAADVRLIITDDRSWKGYGHGRFGETFARKLGAWIEGHFSRTATLRADSQRPRTLTVWTRGKR